MIKINKLSSGFRMIKELLNNVDSINVFYEINETANEKDYSWLQDAINELKTDNKLEVNIDE